MPGRHQLQAPTRVSTRWVAGALGLAIAGASAGIALMAAGPAGAAPTPVAATFSVTGVATSNCSVSIGGADIYVTPGGPLLFKSSLVGMTLFGLPVTTSGLLGFDGQLKIDPGTANAKSFAVSATKDTAFAGLTAGDHPFTWRATALNALGLPLPLGLTATAASAGAALYYSGTIHVTTNAADCGIAVQVPGPVISVSASGVPPMVVGVPPLNLKLPKLPTLPTLPVTVPSLPGVGGTTAPGGGQATGPGGINYTPPPTTVPEQVMGGIRGVSAGVLPDAGGATQLSTGLPDGSVAANPANPQASDSPAAKANAKTRTSTKTLDLASNKAPAAQLPVLLAIIAIIALTLVTATYARLYLLRRNVV